MWRPKDQETKEVKSEELKVMVDVFMGRGAAPYKWSEYVHL